MTPDKRIERAAQIARWRDEALRDEEHFALTAQILVQASTDPGEIRDSLLDESITVEQLGHMASMVVSHELTGRNYGAGRVIGETVAKMLPPDFLKT